MPRRTAEEAARTRAAIVDAALLVVAERGVTAAQLEEIATRASVTRGALYHHFADKSDLVLAVLRERWDLTMAPLLGELAGPGQPRARLLRFVSAFLTGRGLMPHGVLRHGLSEAPASVGSRCLDGPVA
jgi:TetR/AcrR family acrAB operon transcriptional repressor